MILAWASPFRRAQYHMPWYGVIRPIKDIFIMQLHSQVSNNSSW